MQQDEQQQQQQQQQQHEHQTKNMKQQQLLDAVSGCGVGDVRAMISCEGDLITTDPPTNVLGITFASGSVASSTASVSSMTIFQTDGQLSSNVTTTTKSLHSKSTARPVTTTSATQEILSSNGVEINVSSEHSIQSEETDSVAQYKDKLPSTVIITQAKATQPKTHFFQNLATIGEQNASPTIRTFWKSKGCQTSHVSESGLTDVDDGINAAKMSRVAAASTNAATNESKGTSASEEDVDIEYEVNQYVIEEIESTATVVINHPPTVIDLLGKVASNLIMLALVFLILVITLLCILAEREISLFWALLVISMTSLIVFSGLKM